MIQSRAPTELVIERNGVPVKVLMTLLVGAASLFFGAMALLISHSSLLDCTGNLQCIHVEKYPLGFEQREPVAKFESAETEWDPGGRQMAVKLVLNHADGTTTEYQGVGTNGERAQSVAAAINKFIKEPKERQRFALRDGSIAGGIFMALLALVAMSVVPYFFSKMRFRSAQGVLALSIERWPIRPRRFRWPIDQVAGLRLHRTVMMQQEFYKVVMDVGDEAVDLGLGFRSPQHAEKKLAEINSWLNGARATA